MSSPPTTLDCSAKDADDWYGVTDAKQRKKIQDKLAQRARRRRLREAKNNPHNKDVTHGRSTCQHCGSTSRPGSHLASTTSDDHVDQDRDQCLALSRTTCPFPTASDIIANPAPSLTVIGALFINGNILNISCCISIPQKSSPPGCDVPGSLCPTTLQLTTIHQSGIDRFPLPRMRDNMITYASIIDEEEFTRDLCIMPSFTIMAGMAPWDPSAWKIEPYFAKKWNYLFH